MSSVLGSILAPLATRAIGGLLGEQDRSAAAGFAESQVPQIDINRRFSTGASSLQGGNLALDPSIRGIQEGALGGFQGLLSQNALGGFGGRFGQLGQEFAGNQGALINARLNPLRANIAQRRGQLERGLQRRGVQGTFANQDLSRFAFGAGRELGDAQAQATQDALTARSQLLGREQGAEAQALQAQTGLNQLIQGVGAERFGQEMAGLGLSADTIKALLGRSLEGAQVRQAIAAPERQRQSALSGNLLEGLSGALGGLF